VISFAVVTMDAAQTRENKRGPIPSSSSPVSSSALSPGESAFQDLMIDIQNKAALALMLSIGHRTRLFDVIASLDVPSTSQQIASKANLNERYVREWLASMVVGNVIEYDLENNLYWLEREKASYLTRTTKSYNFAASMQWIPVLAQVEDKIIECFKNGGGVEYSFFKHFHDVMAEESAQTVVAGIFDFILPLVPGLEEKLKKGIKVLDIGCGSGHAINMMALRFPSSSFTGYDISAEAIDKATAEAQHLMTTNAIFDVKDVSNLETPSQESDSRVEGNNFDLITAFDAIHDQRDPKKVLRNIQRLLNPSGGTFLMQDILASTALKDNIHHPLGPFLYTVSCMHCMSVSLAQNGAGLGAMWGKEKAEGMLRDAGFTHVEVKTLPHDFQNYYYIAR
jgi:SAM-dependent methyltransferase